MEGGLDSEIQKQWSGTNPTGTSFISFPSPSPPFFFFSFLLSFPILMSTTAFYLGMVPVWCITGRAHTERWGQDGSRVTVMLAERLRALRQAHTDSECRQKSTIMLREMAEVDFQPLLERKMSGSKLETFRLCVCVCVCVYKTGETILRLHKDDWRLIGKMT